MSLDRCYFIAMECKHKTTKEIAQSMRSLQLQIERDLIANIMKDTASKSTDDLLLIHLEKSEKSYKRWLSEFT